MPIDFINRKYEFKINILQSYQSHSTHLNKLNINHIPLNIWYTDSNMLSDISGEYIVLLFIVDWLLQWNPNDIILCNAQDGVWPLLYFYPLQYAKWNEIQTFASIFVIISDIHCTWITHIRNHDLLIIFILNFIIHHIQFHCAINVGFDWYRETFVSVFA